MLKDVLATLLVSLLWTAVALLHLPPWIAGLVTTVVAVARALLFVWAWRKAKRAAGRLESGLSAQGDAHAQLVRPEQEAGIRALEGEFTGAVQALKASRLGKGGAAALYALPWYVIIGPPGAGKSTALRASGLRFPYLSPAGGAVKGIGGTRHCDWWMTNEAILLDTAGRYSTEDDDHEEWLAFLDLLRENRPRRPINGILVATSIAELLGAGEDGAARLAQRLRERIDELTERLEVLVPVYLLFTKCDLLDGFVETFGELKTGERGQIWGFTFPLATPAAPDPRVVPTQAAGEDFARRFETLCATLVRRAQRRIGEERRLEARERIYGFPQQFALLRAPLEHFVSALFSHNVFKESPHVRGIYFTSATQEGRPVDRVLSAMAEAFGVAPRLPAPEAPSETRSYFLGDVFARVIFPDRELGERTQRVTRRRRHRLQALAVAGLLGALLFSSLPAYSFARNRALVRSTEAVVTGLARHRTGASATPLGLAELEPLRRLVEELRDYDARRPPLWLRFGMYSGDALYPKLRELYTEVLRRDVIAPLVAAGIDELSGIVAATPQGDDAAPLAEYARPYDLLEMHLLLTGAPAADEPRPVGVLADWLVEHLVSEWTARLGQADPEPESLAMMRSHARLFVEGLVARPALALARDAHVIRQVRLLLTRVPTESIVLDPIIAEASAAGLDLTLRSILRGSSSAIETHEIVRGAFTRRGWEEKVRPRLALASERLDAWVLGAEGARLGQQAARMKSARAQYFHLYIEEWLKFLRSLRVRSTTSATETLQILHDLTHGQPPAYGKLLRALADNTTFADEPAPAKPPAGGKPAALAADTTGPADVAAAFAGLVTFGVPPTPPAATALDAYQDQLQQLYDAFSEYVNEPSKVEALTAKVQAVQTQVARIIDAEELGGEHARLVALLWRPVENAVASLNIEIIEALAQPWCHELVGRFEHDLRGRYPFDPGGPDAVLADVADIFRPDDGVVWSFLKQMLGGQVERHGDDFALVRHGQRPGLSNAVPGFFERANAVTRALFPHGAKQPLVELEVRILPAPAAASITFSLDGQVATALPGPERWVPFHWPGDGKVSGASLRVRGRDNLSETIARPGEWGFWHLLEQGTLAAGPDGGLAVTWKVPTRTGTEITIDIRPRRGESPLLSPSSGGRRGEPRLLAPFRGAAVFPPHALAPGGGCAVP